MMYILETKGEHSWLWEVGEDGLFNTENGDCWDWETMIDQHDPEETSEEVKSYYYGHEWKALTEGEAMLEKI